MMKNWKLASAALVIAIAVPVTAYAADLQNGKNKKASYATGQTKPAGKQGEKPNPGKDKGLNVDPQTIASSKLGLDQAAFEQAQKDGKSLADLAKEKGIELQPLIDALTTEISNGIQSNLDPKDLTAEEKANVKKKATMEAERIYTMPLNKQGVQREGIEWNLSAAFDLLGIDKAAFAEQVQAGKSLADIAKAHGVSRRQLMDALLSDANAKIDQVTAKGTITQEQAEQKKQAAQKEVEDFIDHTQTMVMMKEEKDRGIDVDLQAIAKSKLGLDQAAFEQAQKEGKSLADIAKEKGIALQPLIDEQTKEISDAIQSKLDPKDLTAEEKANVKKKASMEAERSFSLPLNKERDEKTGSSWNLGGALTLLGIDKAAFAEQVQAGKSLADIAKDHGVTRQQLIDALLSDVNAKIDEVKATGGITQAQADEKKLAAQKDVEAFIDHTQDKFNKSEKKVIVEKN